MSTTKIRNSQFKITSDLDLNNQAIINSTIETNNNVITVNGTTLSTMLNNLESRTNPNLFVNVSYNDENLKGVAVVVDSVTKTTKSNGLVIYTNLSKGSKTISASKDGFNTATSTEDIQNDTAKDIVMQPITLTFTVTDQSSNALQGATITLTGTTTKTATTNANGQAVFSELVDGTYSYIVSLTGYDSSTLVTVVINRANQTAPVILYPTPVNCYAVEAVTLDDDVKVNAGMGNSSYDYSVYDEDTTVVNTLTLDGVARSSASAGGVASVRIAKQDKEINIVADQDNANIDVANLEDIKTVTFNVNAIDKYLCFKQNDNNIYFKNNSLPFIPSNISFASNIYTYYTYANNVMTPHTFTTSSVTVGTNSYDGTTLKIDTTDTVSNGTWTRDSDNDVSISNNDEVVSTSSYLTAVNEIIPNETYFRFRPAKLNSQQFTTKLIIGGQIKPFIDLQEFFVKSTDLIELYITKYNSNLAVDTFNKYFYISNDYIYRKVNVNLTSNVNDTDFELVVNGVKFNITGSSANLDVYTNNTISYTISKTGYVTQTGSYTVPTIPTEKQHTIQITLVAE